MYCRCAARHSGRPESHGNFFGCDFVVATTNCCGSQQPYCPRHHYRQHSCGSQIQPPSSRTTTTVTELTINPRLRNNNGPLYLNGTHTHAASCVSCPCAAAVGLYHQAQVPYHTCVDALPPYCGSRRSEDYFSSPPPCFWFDAYGVPWTPVLPDGGCRGDNLVRGGGGGSASQPQMPRI
ncbi:hypothetical protein DL766_006030 [Monosporascus sp. MC13-8B]|nr:hypothetical protein DL766_006030 [Monosporascus sp. MC13-8B]